MDAGRDACFGRPPLMPGRLQQLFSELKRRRVLRALLGWGIVSFAVLQVVEPVLHALHLPDGVLTGVVAVLALGFPATVVLSWFFDLSSAGVSRTADVPGSGGPGTGIRAPRLTPLFAGLVAAGAILGAGLAWFTLRPAAPPVDADGRVSVAVADFANQTGEPALDALSGLLITSLEQSRKLKVLTRGRMFDLLRQAGREKVERIDESAAREVGQKAGVRALLLASIQKIGGSYVVELRAVDPGKDHYLFTLREQAGAQAELLPLIDRISERTRLALREGEREVQGSDIRVAEAITPNLDAYRHYFLGKDREARIDPLGAAREYRRALEIDPSFVMAAYELAFQSLYGGGRDVATIGKAARGASRLPPREAGLVRALDDIIAGRFGEGRPGVEALAARYPDDREVAYVAAEFFSWGGDTASAIPHQERGLRLAPDNEVVRIQYLLSLQGEGRGSEGVALAEANVRARPGPAARWTLGIARLLVGDRKGGLDALRDVAPDDAMLFAIRAQAIAADGRVPEALASLPLDPLVAEYARSWILSYAGRLREASEALDRAARLPEADPGRVRQFQASLLASARDHQGARSVLASGSGFAEDLWTAGELGDGRGLARFGGLGPTSDGSHFASAMQARAGGDEAEALHILRGLDRPAGSCLPWFRGSIAAERGHHEEAIEALGRLEGVVLLFSDAPQHPWFQARGRIIRARSLESLGRREEARALVDRQLAQWKDADPDLPLLAEAKALRARLASAAPSAR